MTWMIEERKQRLRNLERNIKRCDTYRSRRKIYFLLNTLQVSFLKKI